MPLSARATLDQAMLRPDPYGSVPVTSMCDQVRESLAGAPPGQARLCWVPWSVRVGVSPIRWCACRVSFRVCGRVPGGAGQPHPLVRMPGLLPGVWAGAGGCGSAPSAGAHAGSPSGCVGGCRGVRVSPIRWCACRVSLRPCERMDALGGSAPGGVRMGLLRSRAKLARGQPSLMDERDIFRMSVMSEISNTG